MSKADDKGGVQMSLVFEDENMKNREVEPQKRVEKKITL